MVYAADFHRRAYIANEPPESARPNQSFGLVASFLGLDVENEYSQFNEPDELAPEDYDYWVVVYVVDSGTGARQSTPQVVPSSSTVGLRIFNVTGLSVAAEGSFRVHLQFYRMPAGNPTEQEFLGEMDSAEVSIDSE